MTHPIDTSPEAIAALLDGVTPGPWKAESGHTQQNGQLYWQVHDEHDAIMQNQFCWAQGDHAANARFIAAARDLVPALAAEIARLTAANISLTMALAETEALEEQHGEVIKRVMAERDEARAQVAMAYEAAASHYENGFPAWDTFSQFTRECRALTPADASAALAARDAAMRNEGRRQAAEIARDDAKSETGVILNRRLAGIGVPVAASARRRQAIRTALRILSTLEPEGGQ